MQLDSIYLIFYHYDDMKYDMCTCTVSSSYTTQVLCRLFWDTVRSMSVLYSGMFLLLFYGTCVE